MARFVHLASSNDAAAIARAGLKPKRWTGGVRAPGVYAMPVLASYELTFGWAREVKRWGSRALVAATFVLPDTERVLLGRFNRVHGETTAGQAVAHVRALDDPRGWEVIVPRAIAPAEIAHVRPLKKLAGWRYTPDAHGRAPCGCPACQGRGEPFSGRVKRKWERENG